MGDAPLNGMGEMIMIDLVTLFCQRLNWYTDNLLVYLEYVDDVVVLSSRNGSDDSEGEIE